MVACFAPPRRRRREKGNGYRWLFYGVGCSARRWVKARFNIILFMGKLSCFAKATQDHLPINRTRLCVTFGKVAAKVPAASLCSFAGGFCQKPLAGTTATAGYPALPCLAHDPRDRQAKDTIRTLKISLIFPKMPCTTMIPKWHSDLMH